MPDWSIIVALLAAVLGGGGVAGWLRARGQNQTDGRAQLASEQEAYRRQLGEQIARLQTRIDESEKRNDVLEQELRTQGKDLAALQTTNAYQERQLHEQAAQIGELRTQNATQAQQLAALTEEKAGVVQRLQAEVLKNDFLTRETNDLRREIQRMREKLPARIESTGKDDQ